MNTQSRVSCCKLLLRGLASSAALSLAMGFSQAQADVPYANVPLFWANGVAPNVALVIDTSSSMGTKDTGGSSSDPKVTRTCSYTGSTAGSDTPPLTRLRAAQNAACQVIQDNADSMRISLYRFSTTSDYDAVLLNDFAKSNADALQKSVDGLSNNASGTPLAHATRSVLQDFLGSSSPLQYRCQKNYIVLFTDGQSSVGDDTSSTFTMPSTTTVQKSAWSGSTTKTGDTNVASPNWDGFTDPQITWRDSSGPWPYYPWLDDVAQLGYDIDIKDSSSAGLTATLCGSGTGTSPGKDCAGKDWNGADDSDTTYKQQNVVMYTIGFGTEANNEMMRDTPLVNQVSIAPGCVNTSTVVSESISTSCNGNSYKVYPNSITIPNHGLSTGSYVLYYKSYSTVKLTAAGSAATDTLTISSGGSAPATGTALTYSNNGGTSLTYDDLGTGTATCGAIGGLSSGSSYIAASTGSGSFRISKTPNQSANAFACASFADGSAAVPVNCQDLTSIGTEYTQHKFQVTAHTAGFFPGVSGSSGGTITTTTNVRTITRTGHGFTTGDKVTYSCSGTSCAISGLTSGSTYYVAVLDANTFRLSSSATRATTCAGYPNSDTRVDSSGNCIKLNSVPASTTHQLFTNNTPSNDNSSITITAGASGTTNPVDDSANIEELYYGSHGFLTGDQITYTCSNGSYTTHTDTSATTYYAIYVDATHFKLATSAANASGGTAVDITNGGNSGQTFSYTSPDSTIGGLYPYSTDKPVSTSSPNYSSTPEADGKYYVVKLDENNISLEQCGPTTVTAYTVTTGCWDAAASPVTLTSTGSGILSTGPGKFYNALTASAISDSLQSAFLSIRSQTLSEASLTASSSQLSTGTTVYATTFNTLDWSGDIYAFSINTSTGAINTASPLWQASDVNRKLTPSSRNLITATTSLTSTRGAGAIALPSTGTSPFSLSTTTQPANQTISLGNKAGYTATSMVSLVSADQLKVLNWIRGTDDTTLAGSRTRTNKIFGDILNGSPVYVGSPTGVYGAVNTVDYSTALQTGSAGQSSYSSFKGTSRTAMLYVGANDGMLHGLDATTGQTNSGMEMFGFLPRGVWVDWTETDNSGKLDSSSDTPIQKFYEYTQTGYGSVATLQHHYFVDGPPTVGDAYFGGAWHTVLVGGLGRGGRSVYALDVTNGASFTTTNVLWEFNDDSSGTMGYSYSQPVITRVKVSGTPTWVAIFGNGYDGGGDAGYLYVVDLQTGAKLASYTTGVTNGGLSSPTVYMPTTSAGGAWQGYATLAYAGDLQGNMWRFDLTNLGTSPYKLYAATDSSGNVQPITAAPVVADATGLPYSISPGGSGCVDITSKYGAKCGLVVTFGTGTYFQTSDASYDATPVYDTLYAMWDYYDGSSPGTLNKANLTPRTLATSSTNSAYRTVTGSAFTYSTSSGSGYSMGWYLDLYIGTKQGERIAYSPLLVNEVLFFSTIIPTNNDPCTGGGTGWIYGVDGGDGLSYAIFYDSSSGTYMSDVAGVQSAVGALTKVFYVGSADGTGFIEVQGSNNSQQGLKTRTCTKHCSGAFTPVSGRMTWRQLQ